MGGQRIQPALTVGQRGLDQRTCTHGVHAEVLRQAGWRFHQRVLCFAVTHQMLETAHGLRFGGIGRHACRIERGGGLVVVAQPHREHRLVTMMARAQAERAGQRLRGVG
ncbi:hypothetical protein D3C72_1465860 [compost metagenome]